MGRSRGGGSTRMSTSSHHLLRVRSRGPQDPGTGVMWITRMWRMLTVLLAPLFSLLVLSFGVLPAHESELLCHNRGMEELQPGSEPLFTSEAASGNWSRNDYAG